MFATAPLKLHVSPVSFHSAIFLLFSSINDYLVHLKQYCIGTLALLILDAVGNDNYSDCNHDNVTLQAAVMHVNC